MGKSLTIRVGLGRSSSGKILDKDTKWFTDKNEAISYLATTNKPIFVSVGGKKYQEINIDQLKALWKLEINYVKKAEIILWFRLFLVPLQQK